MALITQHRRLVALYVIVCFLTIIQVSSLPLRGESGSGKTQISRQSEAPGVLEKKADAKSDLKKKKIPTWVWIASGAVAVGLFIVLVLLKKPQYTLTVNVAAGVNGEPATGSYRYKKDTQVAYDYTATAGHRAVAVTLDGQTVPAAGVIKMDRNHALDAMTEEGLHEDFNASPAGWLPYLASEWSVSGGNYVCLSNSTVYWNFNVYDYAWAQPNYTVIVRLSRVVPATGNKGIVLATSYDLRSSYGYEFTIGTLSNTYYIFKNNGYNYETGSGADEAIEYATNNAILTGANAWNTLKIVRAGSSYTFYVNDTAIHSFSDSTYDPRYLALIFYQSGLSSTMNYDYVYVDLGVTRGSLPPQPRLLLLPELKRTVAAGEARP